jgi:hypothetical protein
MTGCSLSQATLRRCLPAGAVSWSTVNASVIYRPTRPWWASARSSAIWAAYAWAWAAWMTQLVSKVSRSMAATVPGAPWRSLSRSGGLAVGQLIDDLTVAG